MEWTLLPVMSLYIVLVAYDAALHPQRRTPLVESALHAVAGAFIAVFLTASVTRHDLVATACLLAAAPALLIDEICYHRGIAWQERRIHIAAFIALVLYVGTWLWMR